jgi:hypothetical protein
MRRHRIDQSNCVKGCGLHSYVLDMKFRAVTVCNSLFWNVTPYNLEEGRWKRSLLS